jgi:hypothetical protein
MASCVKALLAKEVTSRSFCIEASAAAYAKSFQIFTSLTLERNITKGAKISLDQRIIPISYAPASANEFQE